MYTGASLTPPANKKRKLASPSSVSACPVAVPVGSTITPSSPTFGGGGACWGVHGRVWMCPWSLGEVHGHSPVSCLCIALKMSARRRKACWSSCCQEEEKATQHRMGAWGEEEQGGRVGPFPWFHIGQLLEGCPGRSLRKWMFHSERRLGERTA